MAEAIEHTSDGIPYLAPEIVLLFKAKHAQRARDRHDLARALPRLDGAQRRWLGEALGIVHPGHRWIEAVERGSVDLDEANLLSSGVGGEEAE